METTTFTLPSARARQNFVVASLIFHWGIVLSILKFGDPANTLHTSGLAWAFGASVATLFAFIFGVMVDNNALLKASNIQLIPVQKAQ